MLSTVFIYPDMFTHHIKASEIKIPDDIENFDPAEYPHYAVFINAHLGEVISVDALVSNANIIAKLTAEECISITVEGLMEKGVSFGTPGYIV